MIDNNGIEWQWCPTCRARREVTSQSVEVTGSSATHSYTTHETEYYVTYFKCGHTDEVRGPTRSYRDGGA